MEVRLTVPSLFVLTLGWASIFGIWSGVVAALYYLFFLSILSGKFSAYCDRITSWELKR